MATVSKSEATGRLVAMLPKFIKRNNDYVSFALSNVDIRDLFISTLTPAFLTKGGVPEADFGGLYDSLSTLVSEIATEKYGENPENWGSEFCTTLAVLACFKGDEEVLRIFATIAYRNRPINDNSNLARLFLKGLEDIPFETLREYFIESIMAVDLTEKLSEEVEVPDWD